MLSHCVMAHVFGSTPSISMAASQLTYGANKQNTEKVEKNQESQRISSRLLGCLHRSFQLFVLYMGIWRSYPHTPSHLLLFEKGLGNFHLFV